MQKSLTKTRHATTASRPVEMISCNFNPKLMRGCRRSYRRHVPSRSDTSSPIMKPNHITHKAFALSFIALAAIIVGCSRNESLPTELKLSRVLHQKQVSHLMGPGGQNHSFTVYEIPKEVSAKIAVQGLAYLNSLSSALGKKAPGKTASSGPFVDWRATPVSKTARWLRYEDEKRFAKGWEPSIPTFYQSFEGDTTKDDFIISISPEYVDSFHVAISTPGNYYAYGDYRGACLLVVSPKTGKAFYLFRD